MTLRAMLKACVLLLVAIRNGLQAAFDPFTGHAAASVAAPVPQSAKSYAIACGLSTHLLMADGLAPLSIKNCTTCES